jgi:hypothetical protein
LSSGSGLGRSRLRFRLGLGGRSRSRLAVFTCERLGLGFFTRQGETNEFDLCLVEPGGGGLHLQAQFYRLVEYLFRIEAEISRQFINPCLRHSCSKSLFFIGHRFVAGRRRFH